jgi:hypothetical protein
MFVGIHGRFSFLFFSFFHCDNKFLKIKNIFQVKNNLKTNIYHNIKYTSRLQGKICAIFFEEFSIIYIYMFCFVYSVKVQKPK